MTSLFVCNLFLGDMPHWQPRNWRHAMWWSSTFMHMCAEGFQIWVYACETFESSLYLSCWSCSLPLWFLTSLDILHLWMQDQHLEVQHRPLHCQLHTQTQRHANRRFKDTTESKWTSDTWSVMIMGAHRHTNLFFFLRFMLIGILRPWAVCDTWLKSVSHRHKHACTLAHTHKHTHLKFSESLSLIRNNCCMFVQVWNWTKSHSI